MLRGLTLCALLIAAGTPAALGAPKWERATAETRAFGIETVVCLEGDEPVCIAFGCAGGRYEFIEIIVGDWLEDDTRLSAGAHAATVRTTADPAASKAMNIPVSRGPIDAAFLDAIVDERDLRVRAPKYQYDARFPLTGFKAERERLRRMCPAP